MTLLTLTQKRVYAFAVRQTRSHISVHNVVDCSSEPQLE